ncbi:hypothetical protein AMS68_006122 [Peltaster fructicola]|uniref:Uncharacterized protein n=1 Tax=Peltaster fructicola TaxID=286661 RepID=A0A6H0Y121_9PEZI|nr:hypothetical protein AMS68_006122 [Peltaster fructicola]
MSATPSALPTTSDADLALVIQQFVNIRDATQLLDNGIVAYTGPSDTAALEAASDNTTSQINSGTTVVNGIGPYITLGQAASQILPQLNLLKDLVNVTVTNATTAKPLFVSSCIGPTILAALQQQYTAADAFANAVANKIDPSYKSLALSLSQPV